MRLLFGRWHTSDADFTALFGTVSEGRGVWLIPACVLTALAVPVCCLQRAYPCADAPYLTLYNGWRVSHANF